MFFSFLMHVFISISFHMKGFPCPSFVTCFPESRFLFTDICKLAQSKAILFSWLFLFRLFVSKRDVFFKDYLPAPKILRQNRALVATAVCLLCSSDSYGCFWQDLFWHLYPLSVRLTQGNLPFSQWDKPAYHET